jgi:hypothetical protein
MTVHEQLSLKNLTMMRRIPAIMDRIRRLTAPLKVVLFARRPHSEEGDAQQWLRLF